MGLTEEEYKDILCPDGGVWSIEEMETVAALADGDLWVVIQ